MAVRDIHFEVHEQIFLIAFVWQGTYEEAKREKVRALLEEIDKQQELKEISQQDALYSISVHNMEEGFTHYAAVEANRKPKKLPQGLEWLEVPAHTYLVAEHIGSTSIAESYQTLAEEIHKRNYEPYVTAESPIFDPLPIKIERYPRPVEENSQQNYWIRIPVIKKLA
ncbi:effector binding domain-containing protein [Listeria costaricensis]|uniref:effector binding domain-containing protein n=1 Tax=Listeria costaricensis TaxID=2026604 RepID=UPI000C0820CC|nr:effector binding domain-containing protein [Listeria costaricensis]